MNSVNKINYKPRLEPVPGLYRKTLPLLSNPFRYNFLIHPSILFNTIKKEVPGVLQLDDFLLAVRSTELEYEIALTELLYAAQNRLGVTSSSSSSGSTAGLGNKYPSSRLEQEENLAFLRHLSLEILSFVLDTVREPKYTSADDVMFYRVQSFAQEKHRIGDTALEWSPHGLGNTEHEQSLLRSPKNLFVGCMQDSPPKSPVQQRSGRFACGHYPSSVPRLTVRK